MYRKLALSLIGLTILATPLALTASASAATEPTLSCEVIGNTTFTIGPSGVGSCGTIHADSSYVIDFAVANAAEVDDWIAPRGTTVVAGCTPGYFFCDVVVRAEAADQDFTAYASTLDSSGNGVSVSATATIPAVCGKFLC